jgi:hypothetical protein
MTDIFLHMKFITCKMERSESHIKISMKQRQ